MNTLRRNLHRAWICAALDGVRRRAAPPRKGSAPSRFEERANGGFSISQDLSLGSGARGDFTEATSKLQAGDDAGAIALLEGITAEAPELASAHINLGMAYGAAERWEEAEVSLQRALELAPRHPMAYNELGIAQRHQGKFAEARASYEQSPSTSRPTSITRDAILQSCATSS